MTLLLGGRLPVDLVYRLDLVVERRRHPAPACLRDALGGLPGRARHGTRLDRWPARTPTSHEAAYRTVVGRAEAWLCQSGDRLDRRIRGADLYRIPPTWRRCGAPAARRDGAASGRSRDDVPRDGTVWRDLPADRERHRPDVVAGAGRRRRRAAGGRPGRRARPPQRETDWRRGYLVHFRRLVEAGLSGGEAARRIAADGLASLHERMRYVAPRRRHRAVARGVRRDAGRSRSARSPSAVAGRSSASSPCRTAASGCAATPWTAGSTPGSRPASSSRPAPRRSARCRPTPTGSTSAAPRVVALGAGAEMGPLRALLRWGADGASPSTCRGRRCGRGCWRPPGGTAGGCTCRSPKGPTAPTRRPSGPAPTCCTTCPPVADWLDGVDGPLVLGNYVYADGATNVRVCARPSTRSPCTCADPARTRRWRSWPRRPTCSRCPATRSRSPTARTPPERRRRVRGPLRLLSGGRLLRRNYAPGDRPGHLRQPGGAAGSQLRPRQAGAALAGDGRPGGRRDGQPQGRAADPHPLGREATGRWPPPTRARTGSASRCSSRRPATR